MCLVCISSDASQTKSNKKYHALATFACRSWAVPVKDLLTSGINTLSITIRPATTESLTLKATHPYSIPSLQQLGSIGAYTFARKPASDFGW